MGVRDFFKFLTATGYCPDQACFVSVKHKLIVDIKNMMYRFGYKVPIDDANFANSVADAIKNMFMMFEHVVFVNDGVIGENHPKFITATKRSVQRKEAVVKTAKRKAELSLAVVDEKELAKLDRAERAARGVSYEQSKTILAILAQHPNFECVQCEGEADDYIIKHHSNFDFVVSEDSDFLIGGVDCLLRGIGTKNQAVYRTQEILSFLNMSLRQLQELGAIAGNDYTLVGIRGLGLLKAYPLLLKYGSCKDMLIKWTADEHKNCVVPPDFNHKFNQSMLTYSVQNAPWLLNEQEQQDATDQQTQTQDVFPIFIHKHTKKSKVVLN